MGEGFGRVSPKAARRNRHSPSRLVIFGPKRRNPRQTARVPKHRDSRREPQPESLAGSRRLSLSIPVASAGLACPRPAGAGRLPLGIGMGGDLAAARAGASGIDPAAGAGSRMLSARSARLIPFLLLVVRTPCGSVPGSGTALLLRGLAMRAGSGLRSAVSLRGVLIFALTGGSGACFRVIRHRMFLKKPPPHFVRIRSGGIGMGCPSRRPRCLSVQYRTEPER